MLSKQPKMQHKRAEMQRLLMICLMPRLSVQLGVAAGFAWCCFMLFLEMHKRLTARMIPLDVRLVLGQG